MTQSEYLRSAMESLALSEEQFAARLGCPCQTLGKWLLQDASLEYRMMPDVVWTLVREILANESLKEKLLSLEKPSKAETLGVAGLIVQLRDDGD